jgi:membrane fusion protein (multidrug efflux system)
MKRNQIVILGSLFLIFAFIFGYIIIKKKPEEKLTKEESSIIYLPVREVKNVGKTLQIISYGQVAPNAEIDIAFEVQGKLEMGVRYLKPGTSFKQGEVLYRINKEEAKYSLESRKSQLSNLIVTSLPDIELDFNSETKKWTTFLESLQANKRMPELPEMKTSKERSFMTSRGVLTEYYNLKSLESRLDKYTYTAPFTGTVIETYAEPGAIANPGGRVARIAKTNSFEVKVPIALEHLDIYQRESNIKFTTADGQLVGTGKIARISDVINQQTQSVDVYYSIQSTGNKRIFSGLYLNAAINQKALLKSISVPRMAVSDSKVSILMGDKIVWKEIKVVGSKPDSVFISGLEDGLQVILDKVETDMKGKTFKGIMR